MSSIGDTVALDKAVVEAVRFYAKHPGETAIIVTGDHETGGMSIGFAGTKYESYHDRLQAQKMSYVAFTEHMKAYRTAHAPGSGQEARFEDMVPLMEEFFGLRLASADELAALAKGQARGPYAKGKEGYGLVLKEYEEKSLREAFARSMAGDKERSANEVEYLLYGDYDPFVVTLTHILDRKSGIAWTTYAHTGVPVITSAMGAGAETFGGYYDNTDIFRKMVSIMGLTASAQPGNQEPPK
jgi:alkaline phosphatase